jgi:hypothetical protein
MRLATWARRRNRGRARAEVATSRYNGGLSSDNDSNDFTSCDPSDTTRPYSTWLLRRYANAMLFFLTRQTSRATCFPDCNCRGTNRDAVHIRQATLRLLHRSDDATLIRFEGPTQVQASIIHSYQTFVSSVCRHMLTSSSVSGG